MLDHLMSTVGLILTGLNDLKFEKKLLPETLFVNDFEKTMYLPLHAKKGPFFMHLSYII